MPLFARMLLTAISEEFPLSLAYQRAFFANLRGFLPQQITCNIVACLFHYVKNSLGTQIPVQ